MVLGSLPSVQVSCFGVIPKRSQPNQWRLIPNVTAPPEASVNVGIDPELCSMWYSSVEDTAHININLGAGCFFDIVHAYRNIPVHVSERHLLGMEWGWLICGHGPPIWLN